MDKAELRWYYTDRWKLIHEVELAERRAATFEDRLRKFDWIMELARSQGLENDRRGVTEVRERWRRLKEFYGPNDIS
jgi:hypothetical protein